MNHDIVITLVIIVITFPHNLYCNNQSDNQSNQGRGLLPTIVLSLTTSAACILR